MKTVFPFAQAVALGLFFALSGCGSATPAGPAALSGPDYTGIWTGGFSITSCRDIDVAGLDQLQLCGGLQRSQGFRFTLTQNGTSVAGTYELLSPYYFCACGVLGYGTFDLTGTIASGGTLTISALGSPRATGVTALVVFTLNQSLTSTITGTASGHLRFNTPDDRSVFAGVVTSGIR